MISIPSMDIPFSPFETNGSIDQAPLIRPNTNIPNLSLGAVARCSGSTSPTTMPSAIPKNANAVSPSAQADLPPLPPPDLELAPDLPLQQYSPRSQVSSLAPSRRSRLRQHRSRAQDPTPASQGDRYPMQALEEFLVDMDTHSRPLDMPGPRYQPYRIPRARMDSDSHRPPRVDLTSGPDLEVGPHMAHMPIDQGRHLHWDQDHPQTTMSILGMAWVSGGKTIAPMGSHPSPSTHLHSTHQAVANADFQLSMRETGMSEPANLGLNPEDSALWSFVPQKTYLAAQNLPLVPQGLEEYFSLQSGVENHTPPQPQAVDQEPVVQDSLFVELQDSPLEIERTAQRQRALSYSHELRLQQEDQLRRVREKVQVHQQSTIRTPSLQNPHHLDQLQQYRRHSQPMPDPQLPGHTDHPVHLVHPSNRTDATTATGNMGDIDPGLGIDNMSTGPHSQTLAITAQSMVLPDLPNQVHPPVPQQVQGHHYPQEVHLRRAPSRQQASMLGDEHGIPPEMRMRNGIFRGSSSMFLPEMTLEIAPLNRVRREADQQGMGDTRGWGILPPWGEDTTHIRDNTRNNQ
ncbi:hypothetical protein J3R30DRAFT_223279 [Lentinula aciculospora]|uniref:Uncharacterized protein n=1 Tax=Lentinula aciculospora TaxID=153920 RepID=A0A9W9A971_9AGAR|nr:hypothetical protein J3R30DRAFT_223279 [Lentinula aciculospora]